MASVEEMRLAVRHGASAIGLVGPMPSGPGQISDRLSAEIARETPQGVESFLLTQESSAEAIAAHASRVGPDVVQIVREIDSGEYEMLRALLPDVMLVQVIHVEDETAIERAKIYAKFADRLLLDSGRPNAAVAELGGTGRPHDWNVSRKIVAAATCPVYLAGGLNPGNARAAFDHATPFALDVCGGLRTNGALDEAKLAAFALALG